MESSQGREVCLPTHWVEDFCYSAKPSTKAASKQQESKITTNETVEGPIPLHYLNIQTRDQGKLKAIAPSTSSVKEFKDLPQRESGPLKFSVQEENSDIHDNNSQCVVSGSSYDVLQLLNKSDSLTVGTHGVLINQHLKPSAKGQFESGREFDVIRKLGQGGFGEVDLCTNIDGREYVRKQISSRFKRKEVEVLLTLSHENITGLLGYVWRDGTHEILMEYGGLSLKVIVETQRTWREMFTEGAVMKLALQGLSALHYMHSRGVLHLDIKPDNVCITYNSDGSPIIKFTDFGTSLKVGEEATHDGWTPEYMSPEACQNAMTSQSPNLSSVFQNSELTGKCDVFSFGLVLYFMLEGKDAVLDIWRDHLDPRVFASFRPKFIIFLAQSPNYICESVLLKARALNKLLALTLAGDPEKRPTAEEAKIFVLLELLVDQLTLPNDPPPGSEEKMVHEATKAPICTAIPVTPETPRSPIPQEVAINPMETQPGGGKDIKNCLRQKLLRKQASSPYSVDPARKLTFQMSKSTEESEADPSLPVFSVLLDN